MVLLTCCKPNLKGFNLVEIVVAFGLLSVMVAIFFNLIPSSALAAKRAENRLTAGNIAQSEIEKLRNLAFDKLVLENGKKREALRGTTRFQLTSSVSDVAGQNPNHLKLVQVTVSWPERNKDQTLSHELRVFNQNR